MKIKWNDRELWTDIAYELAGGALIAAVSYTHLTLPTNSLV